MKETNSRRVEVKTLSSAWPFATRSSHGSLARQMQTSSSLAPVMKKLLCLCAVVAVASILPLWALQRLRHWYFWLTPPLGASLP